MQVLKPFFWDRLWFPLLIFIIIADLTSEFRPSRPLLLMHSYFMQLFFGLVGFIVFKIFF